MEEQETVLRTLMSEEETAKACLQDISLMDRYLVTPSCCHLLTTCAVLTFSNRIIAFFNKSDHTGHE